MTNAEYLERLMKGGRVTRSAISKPPENAIVSGMQKEQLQAKKRKGKKRGPKKKKDIPKLKQKYVNKSGESNIRKKDSTAAGLSSSRSKAKEASKIQKVRRSPGRPKSTVKRSPFAQKSQDQLSSSSSYQVGRDDEQVDKQEEFESSNEQQIYSSSSGNIDIEQDELEDDDDNQSDHLEDSNKASSRRSSAA